MATPDGPPEGGGGPPGGLPDAVPDFVSGVVNGVISGLEVAASAAGDTLNSIFGCLPWESACDTAAQSTGAIAPVATDLAGVML